MFLQYAISFFFIITLAFNLTFTTYKSFFVWGQFIRSVALVCYKQLLLFLNNISKCFTYLLRLAAFFEVIQARGVVDYSHTDI